MQDFTLESFYQTFYHDSMLFLSLQSQIYFLNSHRNQWRIHFSPGSFTFKRKPASYSNSDEISSMCFQIYCELF